MFEIETQNLTKKFGHLVAVRNLNLEIPKGTIFGFIGPNGSGKSTTVKMLTGLLQPTAGEAFIGGTSILDRNCHTRGTVCCRVQGGFVVLPSQPWKTPHQAVPSAA